MKLAKKLFIITLLCFSTLCFADDEAKIEAENLLNIMGMEDALKQSMSQMLDLQMQQNPALGPFKGVMMEFFNRHMSYESLKPEFLEIYAQTFTVLELREIIAFYETDVGQKAIEQMPALMLQGGQIGAARVQANMGELEAMIQAEAERIQEAQ